MWFNFALEAAVLANLLAQLIKVPIRLITKREWRPSLIFSTGGMPSSHSAFVTALATGVAIMDGVNSSTFAIAFCFAAVVIFDAMGIRRHAGQHAAMLNQMLDDLVNKGDFSIFQDPSYQKRFKELLGHEPMETFCGTLFGIIVAIGYAFLINL
ncbi:MAG TPA: divergent PAP2 family protein [Firmicutes bacterium]|nr:divergent PAP2 family protein [Bacillota bacterium]